MTDALRDELLRVGETAPPAAVPGDLWARGRRARRRDRVVAGGAVLSVLLVLGGVGWVLGGPRDHAAPPTAPGAVEAMPSVIHPVPGRLEHVSEGADETWKRAVAETDLAVGRVSVAFASGIDGKTLPVVITAADGRYHLLRLPGWLGTSLAAYQSGTPALALSPDGRQLAWGWYDRSTFGAETVSAGVRVVDLESGRVRTITLSGGRGVAVGSVSWSPDSRWLVWQGMQLRTWKEDRTAWERNVAGRIAPGATTSEAIAVSRDQDERLAIVEHGTVGWVYRGGYRFVGPDGRPGDVTFHLAGIPVVAGLFGPDGVLAMAGTQQGKGAAFLEFADPTKPQVRDFVVPTRVWTEALPDSRYPATVEPVGWLDERHVVELVTPVHPLDESNWTSGDSELAVMSLRDGDQPAYEVVARVKQGGDKTGRIQALSVAVDLMTLDQPTRDFPAPEWPWSDERKVAVYGGGAVAVLAVLVFAVAYRRGRRLG